MLEILEINIAVKQDLVLLQYHVLSQKMLIKLLVQWNKKKPKIRKYDHVKTYFSCNYYNQVFYFILKFKYT